MHKRSDRELLKTKIVATMGYPRQNIHYPANRGFLKYDNGVEFWNEFLEQFFDNEDLYKIDVIRLNMSFYEPPGEDELAILHWLRRNKNKLRNVALLGDLPGPKLRLLGIENSNSGYTVNEGIPLELSLFERLEGQLAVCVGQRPIGEIDNKIVRKLKTAIGSQSASRIITIGDDDVVLKVEGVTDRSLECVVKSEGTLFNKRGVTIKDLSLRQMSLPAFSEDDESAVDFLIENGYDWDEDFNRLDSYGSFLAYVGISFVRKPENIINVREYMQAKIKNKLRDRMSEISEDELEEKVELLSPYLIAKIETGEAWGSIDNILTEADGAMVARGDLAEQIGPEGVPIVQKQLIKLCNLRGKLVITATEMLASMENNPQPTRAEANDVFNAILDGSDAVMLSGETSKGIYPFHAVDMMIKIADEAEIQLKKYISRKQLSEAERRQLNQQRFERLLVGAEELYDAINDYLVSAERLAISGDNSILLNFYLRKKKRSYQQTITDRISMSACLLSITGQEYKAILAASNSGRTVRMISRFRPDVKIIGAAHDAINCKKMLISYGVYPINCGRKNPENVDYESTDQIFDKACQIAKNEEYIDSGDIVIYIAGYPIFEPGATNLIQIRKIE